MLADDALAGRVARELNRAQNALRNATDTALRPLRLTAARYGVLDALDEEEPLSGAELARRCHVTPQTMQATVGAMQAAGLVDRIPHPEFVRGVDTLLTLHGRVALDEARGEVLRVERALLRGLDPADGARLCRLLSGCAAGVAGCFERV